jgi:hypothetical protein
MWEEARRFGQLAVAAQAALLARQAVENILIFVNASSNVSIHSRIEGKRTKRAASACGILLQHSD